MQIPDDVDSKTQPVTAIGGLRKGVLCTTLGVFAVSLCLPAYWLTGRSGQAVSMPGYMCVLWSPIAIFVYPAAWANLLLLAWVPLVRSRQLGKNLLATAVSLIAVLLALGFLKRTQMPLDTGIGDVDMLGFGLGYYFWASSIAISFAGALTLVLSRDWPHEA